jgi:hypothetical protein
MAQKINNGNNLNEEGVYDCCLQIMSLRRAEDLAGVVRIFEVGSVLCFSLLFRDQIRWRPAIPRR